MPKQSESRSLGAVTRGARAEEGVHFPKKKRQVRTSGLRGEHVFECVEGTRVRRYLGELEVGAEQLVSGHVVRDVAHVDYRPT